MQKQRLVCSVCYGYGRRVAEASPVQWSKATYAYGTALCLLETGGEKEREEAKQLMNEVPELRQRIAGKSIPLEVRTPFFFPCSALTCFVEICCTQSAQVSGTGWPARAPNPRVRVHLPRDRARTASHYTDADVAANRHGTSEPRCVRWGPGKV